MRLLAAALGHPERCYPCIHVAGTNGKGSVSAMLEAIFRLAGWHTGLYTSPHLLRLGERMQVDRVPLSDEEIVAYCREVQAHADRLAALDPSDHPSFFEFMTGAAFLHFARKRVDVGLIEVGLGGRFDATNILEPEIAVITSIGLDHCELLGDTYEQIAFEKAGIIKPGRPVVVGRMPPEAQAVIERLAAERGAPLWSVECEFGTELAAYPTTNLEGTYQRWNAATATLVARLMPPVWRLTPEVVARGLQGVSWPGRWQRIQVGATPVILDATHNAEGAVQLDESLERLAAETGRQPVVVTGVLGERRARALLTAVARHAREIHLVVPHQDRATGFEAMESYIPADYRGTVRRTTLEAVFPAPGRCGVGAAGDTVVVTGSIYLLGEVLERLEPGRTNESKLQDW
ncbi:MAG: bifunctional folylpolyglutamate synthase/dihydrofolate synthase [Opitutaceae bacterium]|nr:bifunctional folylpolyglutamate synthase/dihydrofolate synthase [Opitutaceae bacterium]